MNLLPKSKNTSTILQTDNRPHIREMLLNPFQTYSEWYADKIKRIKHHTPEGVMRRMTEGEFQRRARNVINRISNLMGDKEHTPCHASFRIVLDNGMCQCLGCGKVEKEDQWRE